MDAIQRENERNFLERQVKGSQATRKFRAYLEDNSLTQQAAAVEMGMNEEMLSRYLNGEHLPGLRKARQITTFTKGWVEAYDWLE